MKGLDEKYCIECGATIRSKAEICPQCGVRQPMYQNSSSQQSGGMNDVWITSLLLCFFLGPFGVHYFYLGRPILGLVCLFTMGGCGIWTIIDVIMIATGNFKDANGNLIKQSN